MLRAARNLRTPDAIRLAAAVRGGAAAFVTEDHRHFPAEIDDLLVLSIAGALDRLG